MSSTSWDGTAHRYYVSGSYTALGPGSAAGKAVVDFAVHAGGHAISASSRMELYESVTARHRGETGFQGVAAPPAASAFATPDCV